jgi:hypothetical protein
MRPGVAFEKVQLVDVEAGRTLPRPFAEGGAELWDGEHRRLTLLLDPGRIKRGLVATDARGASLRVGRRYRLEVDPSWKDASGRPLASRFVQEYLVVEEDREVPDPRSWRITVPASGTRAPLVVGFGEALDRGLLEGALVLVGPASRSRTARSAHPRDRGDRAREATPGSGISTAEPVEGSADVGAAETSWSFSPAAAWRPGSYAILVDPDLEDLAGNEMRRPFDREVRDRAEAVGRQPVVVRIELE